MKIGIDSYCCHRLFGEVYPMQRPAPKSPTMKSLLEWAKELGCDGVSLESRFSPGFDGAFLSRLRGKVAATFVPSTPK